LKIFFRSFFVPFVAGCIVSAVGPILATLLAYWNKLDVIVSTTDSMVFIVLNLFPCVIAAAVYLQTIKKPPLLSSNLSISILSGCVCVLGFELFFIMSEMVL